MPLDRWGSSRFTEPRIHTAVLYQKVQASCLSDFSLPRIFSLKRIESHAVVGTEIIYIDDLNAFIHPFIYSEILIKPLLYVGYCFRPWRYSSDYKKIKSLVSWRFVSSGGRQTKKFLIKKLNVSWQHG